MPPVPAGPPGPRRGRPRDRPAPVEHDTWSLRLITISMLCSTMRKVRPSSLSSSHSFADAVHQRGVHPSGGLVEHDRLRVAHQHPGELEQLLLAVGEVAGLGGLEVVDARPAGQGSRARAISSGVAHGGSRASSPSAHGDQHVLQHGHPGEDAAELEAAADPGAGDPVGREPGHLAVAVGHRPGVGLDHAGDAVEERRLARAVGTDEGVDLALLEGDRGVVDGADAAERLGQARGRDGAGRIAR